MAEPDRGRPDVEIVIGDRVAAAVAADAARAVTGVARLEVGVVGLLGEFRGAALRRLGKGRSPHCDGGVRARVSGPNARISVDIAVARAPAVAVVYAVQQAVAEAVETATGLTVVEVTVTVLDIATGEWPSAAAPGASA